MIEKRAEYMGEDMRERENDREKEQSIWEMT